MKPSERIAEIRQNLIREAWVRFGGNTYSDEMWQDKCELEDRYRWQALLDYLDERDANSLRPTDADGRTIWFTH